ncbi:hypothetical protein KVR01_005014 [Diaporthe batatas]|uniref:uncharacterized protein n=1 Tax=Diaporthe batatas TaxID=748121 RepID=UPI001D0421D9|nr:uncharacterized protein KVR01_005014 [Diaporthe batatas]KAG8164739.1 hypothetical protein KVR01_005014 [Diaporthe batatas]
MEDLRAMHIAMAATQPQNGTQRDEWEEWTDDEAPTPRADDFPAPLAVPGFSSSSKTQTSTAQRSSKPRQSTMRIQRLKSRKRQKDQNAKAGIRLVTDMTRFRKGPQHAVQLVKPAPGPHSSHPATGKFSDASALRALEGSPNPGSVGNWAWLKNSPSTASVSTFQGDTTPDSSKIVIGISLPEDDAAGKDISPQTAVVATPFDRLPFSKPSTNPFQNQQPKSAWSPDTEDSFSPARHLRYTSGPSPQVTSATPGQPGVPPVPALPTSLKNPARARLSRSDFDDDSDSTPITLFEEDGHKTPASATSKLSPGAMTATSARSGWWDHLTTPFRERFSPTSKSDKEAPSPAADEWWKGQDEKKSIGAAHIENHPAYSAASASSATLRPHPSPVPIIRVPTPTIASSSSSGASTQAPGHEGESRPEKARAMMEDEEGHDAPTEMPPPYERTPSTKQPKPVRFRAVFPPGHELSNTYPPSPQPGSPGLDGTMTSQGAIKMSDVPLTPALGTSTPLPERKPGTYVTGDHFLANYGNDPAAKIERTRRRHEKEDYVAHKAGGFWRGRGCVPESGCYGRSGREGRQRRRVWIGAICLAFLLLTTLGVVLGVVLSRRMARGPGGDTTPTTSGSTGGSTGGSEIQNTWLNLTDFPPMPTGLSTIVAPDNSQVVNGCAAPSTLWSCSLPPEQQAANEPSDADQPGFIFQIQYDNNTRQLWNMPNGTPPTPTRPQASTSSKASASNTASSSTSASASASATNNIQGGDLSNPSSSPGKRAINLYDTGIAPNPDPPSFQEMWFLGNTTDGIVSDEKAGEPTPFYISFFTNTSGSAGPNMLRSDGAGKRGIGNGIGSGSDSTGSLSDFLPPPPLNADGTGAPAQLRPYPFQQPLRLFDRGLPTEHYGFYSYFNKTIYVTSMDGNDSSGPVAADANGGSREGTAKFLVSWTQTRFIVKIWTRKGGASRLMGGSGRPAADVDDLASMPGTFPYPVTVGEDTHGGSVDLKATFAYGVEPDRHVNTTDATLFANDVGFGAPAVNPRLPNGDLSWGGVDGGTGGCRCEWVNWVEA